MNWFKMRILMPITYANAKSNKNNLCQIKIKKKKKSILYLSSFLNYASQFAKY